MCKSDGSIVNTADDRVCDEYHTPIICAGSMIFNPALQMSLVVRKPVFEVSDLVQHKPSCTATEDD